MPVGITDEDLTEMGLASRTLRKAVLLAFAELIESTGSFLVSSCST
jgi:hypothetical protein